METMPFGLWPSPLTPEQLAQSKRLQDVAWDGERLVWLETRSGHGMVVALDEGETAPRDLTPELSVRARVGYGGGDFAVANGQAYFAAEGRLYRQSLDQGQAAPLTPKYGAWASPVVSPCGRWLAAVQSDEGHDCLALVDAAGAAWPLQVASGADFYMQPAWHPRGEMLAWVEWDHPQMPWDGARLMLARVVADGQGGAHLDAVRQIGGGVDVAVQQPRFSPDGRWLAYISDASGWGALYLLDLATMEHRALVQVEAELGRPAWVQGIRTYDWAPDSQCVSYCQGDGGAITLWQVEVADGRRRQAGGLGPYTDLSQVAISAGGRVAMVASGPRVTERVIVYDPRAEQHQVAARSSSESIAPEWLAEPETVSWPTTEGDRAHGVLYRPAPAMQGIGRPPLIVRVHGGPTSQTGMGFNAQAQFFASRGYAVLDVNYRGSTGYGRAYMLKLREKWGLYDVDDTVSGARYLADQGIVDASRMVVMGGSAGGYTVLRSLIQHPGVFRAGVCLYGVANLFTLASDTHKFEARYLDSMIGPLPETADRYRDRSPVFAAARISDPIAVFQGAEDQVVPLDQAEAIVAALRRSGTPHEYHVFAGEGHGWRQAETIKTFYELALRFLKQYVIYA